MHSVRAHGVQCLWPVGEGTSRKPSSLVSPLHGIRADSGPASWTSLRAAAREGTPGARGEPLGHHVDTRAHTHTRALSISHSHTSTVTSQPAASPLPRSFCPVFVSAAAVQRFASPRRLSVDARARPMPRLRAPPPTAAVAATDCCSLHQLSLRARAALWLACLLLALLSCTAPTPALADPIPYVTYGPGIVNLAGWYTLMAVYGNASAPPVPHLRAHRLRPLQPLRAHPQRRPIPLPRSDQRAGRHPTLPAVHRRPHQLQGRGARGRGCRTTWR